MYTAHKQFTNSCAQLPRLRPLRWDFFPTSHCYKTVVYEKPNKFCFRGHDVYCWCHKMMTNGFTGTMWVCLLKNSIDLYHSTRFFTVFNFLSDFYKWDGDDRSCTCYKVYHVDKLTTSLNLSKKQSTRPQLTLFIPRKILVALILWWLAITFMCKVFA